MQAFAGAQKTMTTALAQWTALKSKDLANVNAQLQQANLPQINLNLPEPPGGSQPR
jgi:hypothetical protein